MTTKNNLTNTKPAMVMRMSKSSHWADIASIERRNELRRAKEIKRQAAKEAL